MTTLYRIRATSKGGKVIYAREPAQDGHPFVWVSDLGRASRWPPGQALDVVCALRRQHVAAKYEPCDELEVIT